MTPTARAAPRQLEDLHRRFRAARGSARDEKWAQSAAMALVLDDVPESAAVARLEQLLETLSASDEPIEELYGPAQHWAKDQLPRLREQGAVAPEIARPRSLREAAELTLTGTSVFSVLLLVVVLIGGGTTTSTVPLATPVALALAIVALQALFAAVLRRRPFIVAVGVTAVTLGALSTAAGWGLTALADQVTSTVSIWWHLPIAGVAEFLAWVLDRRADRSASADQRSARSTTPPETAGRTTSLDDHQWLDEAAAALRLRGDLSDRRIRRLLAEARAHAEDAGSSLVEEFGSPTRYARRHRPQAGVRARRRAWWMAGVALVAMFPLIDDLLAEGLSWRADSMLRAALVAFLAVAAGLAWRTSRHERRAARAG